MKKNITINLFGTLYSIDEDAYMLLDSYIESMKKHFAGKEDGTEIANDIESRIAELMYELKEEGCEPLCIEQIRSIIERIGNPEDIDETTDEKTGNGNERGADEDGKYQDNIGDRMMGMAKKRIFRDTDNAMLGGVLAGLSKFTGVDAVWLRLITVALTMAYGSGILIYLLLWIIVPPAITAEDKLQMNGKEVSVGNLTKEMLRENDKEMRHNDGGNNSNNKNIPAVSNLLKVVAVLMKIAIVVVLSIITAVSSVLLLVNIIMAFLGITFFTSNGYFNMPDEISNFFIAISGNGAMWILLTLGFVACIAAAILSVMTIRGILSGKSDSEGRHDGWCVVGLIIAVCIIIGAYSAVTGIIGSSSKQYFRQIHYDNNQKRIEKEKEWLTSHGWKITKDENRTEDHLVKKGEHFSGDDSKKYIDVKSDHPGMDFAVEQSIKLSPGTYRIIAAARTDGNSAGIFAITGGKRYSAAIPNYGNKGGEIWLDAMGRLRTDSVNSNRYTLEVICNENEGRGHGWSYVTINDIVVKDSLLRYGAANKAIEGEVWNGSYLCVGDFKIERTDNKKK